MTDDRAHPGDPTARIRDGRTDLVFEHVAAGGSATAADVGGTTLLQWCAYYGDVSAVRFLCEHGAALDSLGADRGLAGAVFHGHWQLCQFLLESGADPRAVRAATGENLLHDALCRPTTSAMAHVIDLLLAHGADPNHATTPGVETDGFMRDVRTCGETPLHRAAAHGAPRVIDALLAAGAEVTARDAAGDSPLSWASRALRPDHVLARLCFDGHRIHPDRVRRSLEPAGEAEVRGMELHRIGRPHVRP